MVFGMVTSGENVMPLIIFLHDFRLNNEAYIKSVEELMLHWIDSVAAWWP